MLGRIFCEISIFWIIEQFRTLYSCYELEEIVDKIDLVVLLALVL